MVFVEYLNTITHIQLRFATTLIVSRIRNDDHADREVTFTVILPEQAFIAKFAMIINGKLIVGDVREKEKAKLDYAIAKSRSQSAGHVAQNLRETNQFEITVNVAAKSKVVFNLTYQEMLKRVHGVYKNVINIQPNQNVEKMQIDVYINEKGEINNIHVPTVAEKTGEIPNYKLLQMEDETNCCIEKNYSEHGSNVHLSFKPHNDKKSFVNGQFVVLYDVDRRKLPWEIALVNGYFVHFAVPEAAHFAAPEDLQVGKKHVLFALDVSGSMEGRKITQLKNAMDIMLSDLQSMDKFNILLFSTDIKFWNKHLVYASAGNIQMAQDFVRNQRTYTSTDLNSAFVKSLQCLNSDNSNALISMVILLTDGQPTAGEQNPLTILANINGSNTKRYPIHCLGFGEDANYDLLKTVSSKNRGLARKIYEDSDAALQLTGFFDEIRSPLLTEVKINYMDETVELASIVQNDNDYYYTGGELMVIGKLKNDVDKYNVQLRASLTANGVAGKVILRMSTPASHSDVQLSDFDFHDKTDILSSSSVGGFIERMWAYQSIKKYLKLVDGVDIVDRKKENLKQSALGLSLKYQFVTSLTSLVVIDNSQPLLSHFDKLAEFHQVADVSLGGFFHIKNLPRPPYTITRGVSAGLGTSYSLSAKSGGVSGDTSRSKNLSLKKRLGLSWNTARSETTTPTTFSRNFVSHSCSSVVKHDTDHAPKMNEDSSKRFAVDIVFVIKSNVDDLKAGLIRKCMDEFGLITSKTIRVALVMLGDSIDGKCQIVQPLVDAFSNQMILKNATRTEAKDFDTNFVDIISSVWISGAVQDPIPNAKVLVMLVDAQSLKNIEQYVGKIRLANKDMKIIAVLDRQDEKNVFENFFDNIFLSPTAADLSEAILF